jgi:hypothetical protein
MSCWRTGSPSVVIGSESFGIRRDILVELSLFEKLSLHPK